MRALAFTLNRQSPNHTGALPDGELVEILRTANGRYGSTLAYLVETARSLRTCGIRDRDIERMVALARRHALTALDAGARRQARVRGGRALGQAQGLGIAAHRGEVVRGVDVDQHAGIVALDGERRIARDQAARALVAAQRR